MRMNSFKNIPLMHTGWMPCTCFSSVPRETPNKLAPKRWRIAFVWQMCPVRIQAGIQCNLTAESSRFYSVPPCEFRSSILKYAASSFSAIISCARNAVVLSYKFSDRCSWYSAFKWPVIHPSHWNDEWWLDFGTADGLYDIWSPQSGDCGD
jgi:hypothetical protein